MNHLRSLLNRLLYVLAPGLGQLLDGHYLLGSAVGLAALGTVVLGEWTTTQYRQLHVEYRNLKLPASVHEALAADRRRALLQLGGLYLILGAVSAAVHHPAAEEPDEIPTEE
jgi:hypothetical protein